MAADNVHPYLMHHVHAPSSPSPPPASTAHLLSASPKEVCASYGLPLSEHSRPCHASCLQSQRDPVPSSHSTEGICCIPLEKGLSDAHILRLLYYHLVHSRGSSPTAYIMFALSSFCGSLSVSAPNYNPLKYLFHALACAFHT